MKGRYFIGNAFQWNIYIRSEVKSKRTILEISNNMTFDSTSDITQFFSSKRFNDSTHFWWSFNWMKKSQGKFFPAFLSKLQTNLEKNRKIWINIENMYNSWRHGKQKGLFETTFFEKYLVFRRLDTIAHCAFFSVKSALI